MSRDSNPANAQSRQEDEIREALVLIYQHSYTIGRVPRSPVMFGAVVTSVVRVGNQLIAETERGPLLVTFEKLRLDSGGEITLFEDDEEETRVLELTPDRFTTKFIELLKSAGTRLGWPRRADDGLE